MPLTLVLGPANSAKAGEVLGAYAASASRGALLIVPTVPDVEHYTLELANRGAVLGSVLTFGGLTAEIARRARSPAVRLSALQRERVLARVVARAELGPLAGSAQASGFASSVGELIAELQRSLVTPQRFAVALRAWAAQDERRTAYARDLSSLYLAYSVELNRLGRVDAELQAWQALDALRAAPGRWGAVPVFLYGFDDLHGLERDAVRTLSTVAGAQVTVSLTYEPDRAALSARAPVVEELRGLAHRVLGLPPAEDYYEPGSRVALHHLERNLFAPAPTRIDPGPTIGLLEAGGERAEAELVGAEVLALLRSGVPGEQIAVVYRSLQRSAPVIEHVFHRYGIATATRHQVPWGSTALGREVLALLRCARLSEHEARAEDLLTYLRSPGRLERLEVADGLELVLRRGGLRTAAQARERLGWKLEEIDRLRTTEDLTGELARQARALFAAPHRNGAPALGPDQELDARALAVLLASLSELEELGDEVSGAELIEILSAQRVRAGLGVCTGAVLLAEPLEIRARRFRAVFVCGLQEGEFPAPGRSEPFLSDERRWELAAASGLVLAAQEDALARERYLFYSCLSRASERVVLSYRSSDEEGNLALASPFLTDVADLLVEDWSQRRRHRLLSDVVWESRSAPTAAERARSLAAATAPIGSSAGLAGEAAGSRGRLGGAALGQVRHVEIVSAGALESYGECPVKWLVERELAPVRFGPEPDPLARGSYIHTVLEELLRRLDGPVTGATLADANRILDAVLSESSTAAGDAVAAGCPPGLRAGALRAIEADLRRYLEHEAAAECGWDPQGIELRFGFRDEAGSLPALELGTGPERVRLRGVVDRVDVDRGRGQAIVRDYKSGRARPEHQGARWRPARRLQVALYMLAVRDLLGLEPVAGLYQPLSGGDLRARGVFLEGAEIGGGMVRTDARSSQELGTELEAAAAEALSLTAALRRGELTPCPQTCSRDGCRYPGICRAG
ncbi:MAG: PD-(D/E)XK nuclease family protein [Solirubrobacteraceae bacterium]